MIVKRSMRMKIERKIKRSLRMLRRRIRDTRWRTLKEYKHMHDQNKNKNQKEVMNRREH